MSDDNFGNPFDDDIVENVTDCPECDQECGHQILSEKKVGRGSDYLLKCHVCQFIHKLQIRQPKALSIPVLLSEGPNTILSEVEVDADEILNVGDIFEHEDASWEINRIETKTGNSRKSLIATRIGRANAIRSDIVMVRLTLTQGEYSESDSIFVDREKIFKAGSIMSHDNQKWKIRAIHTGAGRTMHGSVIAHDIKRIYLHEPPRIVEDIPRTPRERRQAWKEGRLGDNPNPVIPESERAGRPKQQNKGKRRMKKRR